MSSSSASDNGQHTVSQIIDLSVDFATNPTSSEIDEDDELFAPLNGYDSSGHPRIDRHQPDSNLLENICRRPTTDTTGTTASIENLCGNSLPCSGTKQINERDASISSIPPYTGNSKMLYIINCKFRRIEPDQDRLNEIEAFLHEGLKRKMDWSSSESSSDSSSSESDSSSSNLSKAIPVIQPECNISIKGTHANLGVIEPTKHNKQHDTRSNAKIKRDNCRKIKQRRNRRKKKTWKIAMVKHRTILNENGLLYSQCKFDTLNRYPSYSMIQSLSGGFSMVMYSATHDCDISTIKIHRDMGIRLVLGPNMTLLWCDRLYYACGRTRYKAKGKGIGGYHYSVSDANMSPSRRARYTQSENKNSRSSRKKRTRHRDTELSTACRVSLDNLTALVPMYDTRLFCQLTNEHEKEANNGSCIENPTLHLSNKRSEMICKQFLNFDPTLEESHVDQSTICDRCRQDAIIVDLSTVPHVSYRCGDAIVGDLKKYGWLVVRSPIVHEHTEHEILLSGATCGKLEVFEPEQNRNHCDRTTNLEEWESPSIEKFMEEIKEYVIDRNLPGTSYIVSRKTLLENMNIILNDQWPQCNI